MCEFIINSIYWIRVGPSVQSLEKYFFGSYEVPNFICTVVFHISGTAVHWLWCISRFVLGFLSKLGLNLNNLWGPQIVTSRSQKGSNKNNIKSRVFKIFSRFCHALRADSCKGDVIAEPAEKLKGKKFYHKNKRQENQ